MGFDVDIGPLFSVSDHQGDCPKILYKFFREKWHIVQFL